MNEIVYLQNDTFGISRLLYYRLLFIELYIIYTNIIYNYNFSNPTAHYCNAEIYLNYYIGL